MDNCSCKVCRDSNKIYEFSGFEKTMLVGSVLFSISLVLVSFLN